MKSCADGEVPPPHTLGRLQAWFGRKHVILHKTLYYSSDSVAPSAGGRGGCSSEAERAAPCASGVVGKPKQLDGAGLAVVVVLAVLVVAGVRQQRPLRVPRHREGGRVALHLPQLLSCTEETSV